MSGNVLKNNTKGILVYIEKKPYNSKRKIPSKFRIGYKRLTSIAVIGGKLFSNHLKNMNHSHKDTKDLVSVIINLGTNISGGDTVFYNGVKTSDLGNRTHVLKHLHGRMIFGPFDFFS